MLGLMVRDSHDLPCIDDPKEVAVGNHVQSLLNVLYYFNMASLVFNSTIVPYFDVRENFYPSWQSEKQKQDGVMSLLVNLVRFLEYLCRANYLIFGFMVLHMLNAHASCFKQDV